MTLIYGVILAGGKGERFWPLSRSNRPKQFLKLTSERTMLDETIDRVVPLCGVENIRIVTGESMAGMILDESDYIKPTNLLTEPIGRNTCVAIGLAAKHLQAEDPKAVMVVLSADHLIKPPETLRKILGEGAAIAATESRLITIGIVPTRPETAYGYIKLGDMYKHQGGHVVYQVSAFAEKPRQEVAHDYYYSGKYLWNSGMFIWSAQTILDEIARCTPDLAEQLNAYGKQIGTTNESAARQELYEQVIPCSIDVAVLENAENVLTIKADIMWDDIGGWNALERYKPRDSDNNVIVGDAIVEESYETTVYNQGDGIIACLGVSDLVIVRSGDITMVVHKTRAGEIKKLLTRLGDNENYAKYL